MKQDPEKVANVERLIAEGRYYEAVMEATMLQDLELHRKVSAYVNGETQYEAKLRALGTKRAEMKPDGILRIADEAMGTDEGGARVGLARRLMMQAGLTEEAIAARYRQTGQRMESRFFEAKRLRFYESAMKYYGAAGDRASAIKLASRLVERFLAVNGSVLLTDATDMLEQDVGIPATVVDNAIPVLGAWRPVRAQLDSLGWFDALDSGSARTDTSQGDAIFDRFYETVSGKSFASFGPAIEERMHAVFPRRLILFDGKTVRKMMDRWVRLAGLENGLYAATEFAKHRYGDRSVTPKGK